MIVSYRKDTFILPIEVTDPSGLGVDFTGSAVQFTLSVPNNTITEENIGVDITKDASGHITITLSATLMKTIPVGIYPCEVFVIYSNGTEETLFVDNLKLLGGVPR